MSLEELRADAAQIDAAATPQTAEGAAPEGAAPSDIQPAAPTNADAISFLAVAFREIAGMVLKVQSVKVTLADAECAKLGGALGPVADHYGINLGGAIGGVWAPAILVAGPICANVYAGISEELGARQQTKPQQIEGATAAPAIEPPKTEANQLPPAGEAAEFAE